MDESTHGKKGIERAGEAGPNGAGPAGVSASASRNPDEPGSRGRRRRIKGPVLFCVLLVAVPVLLLAGVFLAARLLPAPPLTDGTGQSRVVQAVDGRVLTMTMNETGQYRIDVPLESLSPALVEATLAYEDRHFRSHPGVNPVSLARAAAASLIGRPIGGSTVTMQVARMAENLDTRTVPGKLRQCFEALRLEAHHSKDAILEAYFNLAPYGGNIVGAGAASWFYFGKGPGSLTREEALLLSVVPQNPVKRRPDRTDPGAGAPEAYRLALERLPDGAAYTENVKKALEHRPVPRAERRLPFEAPHLTRLELARGGDAHVTTSIDADLQRTAERLLTEHVKRLAPYGIDNGALLIADARTGSILAYVGSADFFDKSIEGEVDGIEAKRSPGSTLKPFIYGAALSEGLITPQSVVFDEPVGHAGWFPKNADGAFLGHLSATDALNLSRNIPAIELARGLHPDFYSVLTTLGITLPESREHYGMSLVLGGAEVTPRELARAYTAILEGGRARDLSTRPGRMELLPGRAFSPEAAWALRFMMEAPQRAGRLPAGLPPTGFKTGTSNQRRDAWCAGYTGPYVVVVWLGRFDARPNPYLEGEPVAKPLFIRTVEALPRWRGFSFTERERALMETPPEGVRMRAVCRATGDVPVDSEGEVRCTDTVETPWITGVSPSAPTGLYERIIVNTKTGERACSARPGETHAEYRLVWPDSIRPYLTLSEKAASTLPPLEKACAKPVDAGRPDMRHPKAGVTFLTGTAGPDKAVVRIEGGLGRGGEAKTTELTWYLDGRRVAGTRPGEGRTIEAGPGRHVLVLMSPSGERVRRVFRVTRP